MPVVAPPRGLNLLNEAVANIAPKLTPLELEVAQLLVNTLHLEEAAEAIPPEEPLFVEGLGLDSIDALEIALAISKVYGFEIKSDDADNRRIFANLRALAAHVAEHRTR
jgi:acyl carrier protein